MISVRAFLDQIAPNENETSNQKLFFLLSDFSQIELRILAELSGDKNLIQALSDPTRDFFEDLASKWLYVFLFFHLAFIFNDIASSSPSQINKAADSRTIIKRLCYGFLYGQGIDRMSKSMGQSASQTTKLMTEFKNKYPVVVAYQRQIRRDCRQTGGLFE
jgi:DNA polymerase I